MDKHTVTKHDKADHDTETVVAEDLSFYEAFSLMVDLRSARDGHRYRIGRPYRNIKWKE